MAHPQEEQIKTVIELLRLLKYEAKTQLSAIPDILASVIAPLNMVDNRLSHLIGAPLTDQGGPSRTFGPIRLNKPVEPAVSELETDIIQPVPEEFPAQSSVPMVNLPMTVAQSAEQSQKNYAEYLKAEREKIYPGFADRDPAELLDVVEDPLIRAVAKLAGVKVSENIPAKITLDFIVKIQTKMKNDKALALKIETGLQNVSDTESSSVE